MPILTLAAALSFAAAQAQPQTYRPVTCERRAAYSGKQLRAPIAASLPVLFSDAPLPAYPAARLEAAFDQARQRTGAEAMSVAVARLGEGQWSRTELPAGAERLWWASAGKTFVAVVVMQLVQEGKLRLDDPVSRWVANVPNARVVAVGDLLRHTSGLFSANEDLQWRAKAGPMALPAELAILRRHGAMFCPGANWRYSNSGYALLGHLIERVEGRPWQEAVEARIVRPLGLSSVRVLRTGEAAGTALPKSEQRPLVDPAWPGPAGGISARAEDMVRFWAALLDGRLVTAATRDMMFAQLYPMFDAGTFYGLGVMAFDVPDGAERLVWLGHAGGAPGANALVAYSPRDNAIVAAAVNADAPAAAIANLMLKALRAP